MNYIVFDLEFNQGYHYKKEEANVTNPKCPFEIIQIGAVKLNEKLQTIATFDKLVKPKIYKEINPFVKKITGITIESLNRENPFSVVLEEFVQFIDKDENVLCVWGTTDIKELFRNIKYHNLDTSLIPKEYINIQRYVSKYLNYPKGMNVGLSIAVESFGIPLKDKFHNALNDAYYTSEIFNRIFNKKIKVELYNLETLNVNRESSKKRQIDTDKLYKQFEKMFNREMTAEEKSIIKLAYMMGKTNQFQN